MMVICPPSIVDDTLSRLHEAGRRGCECVVLWLGKRRDGGAQVMDAYLPLQTAKADMFRIPPAGMAALQAELRKGRLMVAAQVHSHPKEAFHSRADDQWAIVRHEGALSLVLPDFALGTAVGSFLRDVKVYQLSPTAKWVEVSGGEVESTCLRIV